jgi:hypothetical protein
MAQPVEKRPVTGPAAEPDETLGGDSLPSPGPTRLASTPPSSAEDQHATVAPAPTAPPLDQTLALPGDAEPSASGGSPTRRDGPPAGVRLDQTLPLTEHGSLTAPPALSPDATQQLTELGVTRREAPLDQTLNEPAFTAPPTRGGGADGIDGHPTSPFSVLGTRHDVHGPHHSANATVPAATEPATPAAPRLRFPSIPGYVILDELGPPTPWRTRSATPNVRSRSPTRTGCR